MGWWRCRNHSRICAHLSARPVACTTPSTSSRASVLSDLCASDSRPAKGRTVPKTRHETDTIKGHRNIRAIRSRHETLACRWAFLPLNVVVCVIHTCCVFIPQAQTKGIMPSQVILLMPPCSLSTFYSRGGCRSADPDSPPAFTPSPPRPLSPTKAWRPVPDDAEMHREAAPPASTSR